MEGIKQKLDFGILSLTLDNPEKLNALSYEMLGALLVALSFARDNPAVKAVLITGSGRAFCAGADIECLSQCDSSSAYEFACFGQKVFRQLESMGKPSLAAINGYALGGGCELAMAATMRIAAASAQFAQPEIKLGVIPGYGGTQRLARLIGKGRALDLCLTARRINAETALSWGLVSELVADDLLLARAYEILSQLIKLAPLAITAIIESIDRGYDMSLDDGLHLEAMHFAKICASTDKTEGIAAFLEKRPAQFIGR